VQHVHAITVSRVTGYVSHGVPSVCILLFSLPSLYVTDGRATKSLCNRWMGYQVFMLQMDGDIKCAVCKQPCPVWYGYINYSSVPYRYHQSIKHNDL